MTPEQWDTHWHRIRQDATDTGHDQQAAGELADRETADQFGARPDDHQDGAA